MPPNLIQKINNKKQLKQKVCRRKVQKTKFVLEIYIIFIQKKWNDFKVFLFLFFVAGFWNGSFVTTAITTEYIAIGYIETTQLSQHHEWTGQNKLSIGSGVSTSSQSQYSATE